MGRKTNNNKRRRVRGADRLLRVIHARGRGGTLDLQYYSTHLQAHLRVGADGVTLIRVTLGFMLRAVVCFGVEEVLENTQARARVALRRCRRCPQRSRFRFNAPRERNRPKDTDDDTRPLTFNSTP